MALPFFYKEDLAETDSLVMLDEAASKHIVQVLRMQAGEALQLTNGCGGLFRAVITDNNRKRCVVNIVEHVQVSKPRYQVTIAISLLKNTSRFEWFLEKATETGVTEIIPLICTRTEKASFKTERLSGILISAMLQSQQSWLPVLHEPVKFNDVVKAPKQQQKFIAHCIKDTKRNLTDLNNETLASKIILIGPEGDFTTDEVELALQHNFNAVSLGETRLRTETAGMVSAVLLCLV